MQRGEPTSISLTGKNSHTITIPLGQGSFSIGEVGMDPKKHDVLVDENVAINWDCFNKFFTPSGKQNEQLYPNGNWPRLFRYWGNDSRFIQWSQKRKIEDFHWSPLKPLSADFTDSSINRLIIRVGKHQLQLVMGVHRYCALKGNLENLRINGVGKVNSLSFSPTTSKETSTPYTLPDFEMFRDITRIDIYVSPTGQAFDCKSLLQFKHLTYLSLSGNLTNLEYLAEFENLHGLGIRYSPVIENLPPLKSWKKLTSFIGWNIEETKGKLLRTELRKLAKERDLKHSSVSQLRKSIWFKTEYGIPFASWEGKNAKTAIKVYKATIKKLKKAKEEQEIKELLMEFTKVFNDLDQIETTEREDIAEAVDQLRQIPSLIVDADKAIQWYDSVRDY